MNWLYLAIIAAILAGLSDIFAKKVLKKEHTFEYLAIFYIFSFLFLLPFAGGLNTDLSLELVLLIVLRVFFVFCSMTFFVKSLKHLPISTVAPLSNLSPLFVFLFDLILFSEGFSYIKMCGILLIVFGAYTINTHGHLKDYEKPFIEFFTKKYMKFILLFSLFFSLSTVVSKFALRSLDSYSLLFYTVCLDMVLYLSIIFVKYGGMKDLKNGVKRFGLLIFFAALFSIVGSYLALSAIGAKGSVLSIVIAILHSSILIDVLLGGSLFHEKHIKIKAVGSVIMIAGLVLLFVL